jgi:hypothetical protein
MPVTVDPSLTESAASSEQPVPAAAEAGARTTWRAGFVYCQRHAKTDQLMEVLSSDHRNGRGCEDLEWSLPVEDLAGAGVEFRDDLQYLCFVVQGQVGLLREVLT